MMIKTEKKYSKVSTEMQKDSRERKTKKVSGTNRKNHALTDSRRYRPETKQNRGRNSHSFTVSAGFGAVLSRVICPKVPNPNLGMDKFVMGSFSSVFACHLWRISFIIFSVFANLPRALPTLLGWAGGEREREREREREKEREREREREREKKKK